MDKEQDQNTVRVNVQNWGAIVAISLGVIGLVKPYHEESANLQNQMALLQRLESKVEKQGDAIVALQVTVAKFASEEEKGKPE